MEYNADMNTSKLPVGLLVVLGAIVLLVLWAFGSYNGLVSQREAVDASWAQVETQYQRRFDLIPNLVKTVQGASDFEQSTLQSVTEARTKWMGAGTDRDAKVEAAQEFDSALSRLLVTVEAYPQLQATQAYRDLMTELEGTENRIGVARKDFNEAVQTYNVKVKSFPMNILAGAFGFNAAEFFDATAGSENAPSVDFSK